MELKVGEVIKAKREEKKIPLVEFAKTINISPGYLSQLENGKKRNPKLEILLKIADELDLDMEMLLGVDGQDENIYSKIPSLLKLTLAKDRNLRALEDTETLKKVCNILDKILQSKYMISEEQLYNMYLEDLSIQTDNTLKRYMAIPMIFYNKE